MTIYDKLAPVYDRWITGDSCCLETLRFYLDWLEAKGGRIVEGGVGTGRIAIELARRGQKVAGIDNSRLMLALAREKARDLGVDGLLSLLHMDIRNISLRGIDIFVLPFRTIGHFTSRQERALVFAQVHACLTPGGRFVFDHYVPDLNWAKLADGRPILMYASGEGADAIEISDTYRFDFERGLMHCRIDVQSAVDGGGMDDVEFDFAWVTPDEVRDLAETTGFEIESAFGDFEGNPLTASSEQQIWVLRRPCAGLA